MNVVTNNEDKCSIALAALKNVIDPEIGLNIVDLGLIYEMDFNEDDNLVNCTMTLTTQFCPMGDAITSGATNALQLAFKQNRIDVNLTFEPPWSSEMISDEGHVFLNG